LQRNWESPANKSDEPRAEFRIRFVECHSRLAGEQLTIARCGVALMALELRSTAALHALIGYLCRRGLTKQGRAASAGQIDTKLEVAQRKVVLGGAAVR
jgi:hypothetical protein